MITFSLMVVQALAFEMNFFVNGRVVTQSTLEPRVPALWEFTFDHRGERVKDFKPIMGRAMHVVVIRRDLSTFAHFHGNLDKMMGMFQSTVHLPTQHPDNQQSLEALPSPGRYFVVSEVQSQSLGLRTQGEEILVGGEGSETRLVEDRRLPDGRWIKSFAGGEFLAYLSLAQRPGCRGTLVDLEFELLKRQPDGSYAPPAMQPWLMMGAHGILVSEEGRTFKEKAFYHVHAELLEEGDSIHSFSAFHTGEMGQGLYKFWVQIKVEGQVRTWPMVFEYVPAEGGC